MKTCQHQATAELAEMKADQKKILALLTVRQPGWCCLVAHACSMSVVTFLWQIQAVYSNMAVPMR